MVNGTENLEGFSTKMPLISMLEMMGMNDNPRLQMIAEMVQKQNAAQLEASMAEEEKKFRRRKLLGRLRKIVDENEQLRYENRILMDRIEILAYALGACPECWGDDGQCEVCKGQGRPGRYIPEKEAFDQYVLPVLKSLRRKRMKTDSLLAPHMNGKKSEIIRTNPEKKQEVNHLNSVVYTTNPSKGD